ncbi:Os04g0454250, partial [Oryza sativa Japonica Group]
PVPVPRPDGAHGLERHPLGLRQERPHEGGHDGDPGRVVEERGVLEAAQHGEERLREHEGGAEVDGHADPLPRRPDLHREYLAGDHPRQRAPRPPERRREDARQRQHRHGVAPRHRRLAVPPDLRPHDPRHRDLAGDHHEAAGQEQHPAAVPVHRGDGDEGGAEVDGAEDDGPHQRRVAAEPGRLEEHRREEGDDDDAGELLEQRHGDGHHQVGAVLPPEDPAVRALLVGARRLDRARHALQLGVHVRLGAAHAPERGARLLHPPAHEEAAGGVRDEQRADEDDGRRRRRQAEGETPPPPRDARRAVVCQVGRQVADAEEELEPRRECTPPLRRRRLRQVHRRRLHA